MTDIHTQLQTALKKKKDLDSEIQRLQGKLEIARQNLELIENECAEMGIDPNNLDTIIAELTEKYELSVTEFVKTINELDVKLEQYR
tara:strand:- start:102 stop:362 length:261 start_codon:yes stop_codon:yes gene_type:complete